MPKTKPKMLVVLQTEVFFRSAPCLKEVHAALTNDVEILPVRLVLEAKRRTQERVVAKCDRKGQRG
jgi:hypothetical protein